MSIPIVNIQPKPSLGGALGEGIAGGLGKLIQQHRLEKMGEKVGAPKGFFSLFENPEQATKAYSQLRQAQLMQQILTPEEESSMQDMGLDTSSGQQIPAKSEMMGTKQSPMQGSVSPRHLIAAAGTPLEQPFGKIYEAQERKAAKREAYEKEPYVAAAKEYFSDLNRKQKNLPATKTALESEIDAIKRGDVKRLSGGTFASIARSLGAPEAMAAMFETPGSKQFRTAQKTFLSNTLQETMRGTTSGKQIDLVEGLLAEVGASKEANLASVWLLKTKALLDEKEIQIANQLRKQGVPSYEIPAMVSEQIEPYRQEVSDQYMEAVNSLIKK